MNLSQDTGEYILSLIILSLTKINQNSTNSYDKMKVHFEFTQINRNQSVTNVGSRTTFNANQSGSNNVITQQHYLMRNHTDAITDIIITEAPYSMIISGDRDGVIKIIS